MSLTEIIDIVERLILATEDDLFQYGINPEECEDLTDGYKLLTYLKNCRNNEKKA